MEEPGVTTGVSEARSHQHRGKKTPTLMTPKLKTQSQDWEHESVKSVGMTIRRSDHEHREMFGSLVMPYGT
jgi:hypothetical protein